MSAQSRVLAWFFPTLVAVLFSCGKNSEKKVFVDDGLPPPNPDLAIAATVEGLEKKIEFQFLHTKACRAIADGALYDVVVEFEDPKKQTRFHVSLDNVDLERAKRLDVDYADRSGAFNQLSIRFSKNESFQNWLHGDPSGKAQRAILGGSVCHGRIEFVGYDLQGDFDCTDLEDGTGRKVAAKGRFTCLVKNP